MSRNKLLLSICVIILAAAIMVPIVAVAQQRAAGLQPGTATVTAVSSIRSVPIKAEPNSQADNLVWVFEGQTVNVLEVDNNGWAHVTYGDVEGWVFKNFLVNSDTQSASSEQDAKIQKQNVEIGRRVVEEIWGGENASVENFTDLYSSHFTRHANAQTTSYCTCQDQAAAFSHEIHDVWPDLEVAIRDIYAIGDTVVVHFTARGTFTSASQPRSFLDRAPVQPTNKQGIWDFVIIDRIADGKIVEEWWFWNRELIEAVLGEDGVNN